MTVANWVLPRSGKGHRWAAAMLVLWVVATLSQAACTTKVPTPTAPPPQGPSLVPDSVQVIFTDNCAFSGCHAGASPAGGLDLGPDSSFAALVGVPSQSCSPLVRVRPSRPDSSCLMLRLTGAVAPQMPLGGSPTPAQTAVVRGWIEQGAGPAVAAVQMFVSARSRSSNSMCCPFGRHRVPAAAHRLALPLSRPGGPAPAAFRG